jgi:O-antigen/teichoic acid export membrane protein
VVIAPAPAASEPVDVRARQRDRVLVAAFLSGAGGRLLTPLFGALAVGIATRALGDVRYGVVATLGSLLGLLIFTDLGVGNAFMTRLAAAYGRDSPEDMRRVVSAAWWTMLACGAVVLAGGLAAAVLVPWPRLLGAPGLPEDQIRAAVVAFAVVVAVSIPATVGQRVLMSLHRGAAANTWAVVAAALTPGAVALTAVLDAPLWAFLLSSVGVPVLVSVVQTAWVLLRSYPHLRPSRRSTDRASMRALIGVGSLYLVLNLASAVAYHADALMVAAIQGAAAAAVFGVVLRVFRMVSGLAVNGSEQLWTVATSALTTGDVAWLRSRFLRVAGLTAVTMGLLGAILVVAGRPLIRLWVGESLVPPLSLLVVAAVWTTYSAVIAQVVFLLNAAEIVRPQVLMAVSMAVVNVALSIQLTRHVGLVGPLVGSLVAHLLCYGVPAVLIARRVLRPTPPEAAGA